MIVTKIQSRGEAEVPIEVREALGVGPGDLLRYEIEDGRVIVSKADEADLDDDLIDDETLRPIIDAAFASLGGPTYSAEETFGELRAHIESLRRRTDAA